MRFSDLREACLPAGRDRSRYRLALIARPDLGSRPKDLNYASWFRIDKVPLPTANFFLTGCQNPPTGTILDLYRTTLKI